MVGEVRFELTLTDSQNQCFTKLSYSPILNWQSQKESDFHHTIISHALYR